MPKQRRQQQHDNNGNHAIRHALTTTMMPFWHHYHCCSMPNGSRITATNPDLANQAPAGVFLPKLVLTAL
jgi:hypothetical protein